jgi:hypothetical protein
VDALAPDTEGRVASVAKEGGLTMTRPGLRKYVWLSTGDEVWACRVNRGFRFGLPVVDGTVKWLDGGIEFEILGVKYVARGGQWVVFHPQMMIPKILSQTVFLREFKKSRFGGLFHWRALDDAR